MTERHQAGVDTFFVNVSDHPSVAGRSQIDGPPYAFVIWRGEPRAYVTVSHAGVKAECDKHSAIPFYDAVTMLRAQIGAYLAEHPGDIVWRTKPHVAEGEPGHWYGHARLLTVPTGTAAEIEVPK